MKETFKYYIDAIVYALIFALTIKILERFKIEFNYMYVILITLIIFVAGKMILRRFVHRKKEEDK